MKTLKLIFLAFLFSFISCNNKNTDKKNDSDLLARIQETKEIKVGYVSYPPGFIVDPNTKEKSGIFNDVLLAIAEDNNLKINYKEEVTWATMIESLKTGRVDLIANPVWATNERKKNADFSTPVYFSPIGIYVRENDHRFDNDRAKINDPKVKIAGVDGEINTIIGREDFPKAQLNPFPNNIDVAQLYLEIESGRKDVTFAEPMFAYDYMSKNPGKIKNIGKDNPIRSYPNSFMFKQNESRFKEFLDESINKLIENGKIDKIIKQYEPFEGAIINVKDSLARDIQ
ncbi:MAG: amino acid ABC transporter substrate-binding protein [Flavobacteriaceae bacterium]|nr:amino acid ABC transporter substrate-binding protein [Flavobacteriaceae bacterium]